MSAELKSLRLIGTKVWKAMLAGINLSKAVDSILGRIKRLLKAPEGEFLSDSFFPGEDSRWQQAISGHPTGKILVDLGVIKSDQLEEALKRQRELQEKGKRKSLAILLVEMGYTTSKDYLEALSKHFRLPIISLLKFIPSPSLEGLIPDQYAFYHKILVLGNYDNEVKVALAEPHPLILEELKKLFKCKEKIFFYLANPFEVESCFRRIWDPYAAFFYR